MGQQATNSHITQCQVVILFWKIKRIRGWGSCSFRMRWSRGSFWGDVHWAESCHDFYYTRFGGLIIIFGAMEFIEASLQGFWLINLKDLLRSWDFGVSDTFERVISGSVSFFSVSFPAARTGEMNFLLVSWLSFKADRALPVSPGWLWAGLLNLAYWWYACPVFKMRDLPFTSRSTGLTTWMLSLEWSPCPEATDLSLAPSPRILGPWYRV